MSIKTRLSALERKAGTSESGALHHHVQIVDEKGAPLRVFCGKASWHGRRCAGEPDIVLILPDNGRGDDDIF